MIASENCLADFVCEAEDRFTQTMQASGGIIGRQLAVAGHPIRLEFGGRGLLDRVMPALAHLAVELPEPPKLKVFLWDTETTGLFLPPPPWKELRVFERGNLRIYRDERFTLVFDRRTYVFCVVDKQRHVALYWTPDATLLPYYELGAPLRHLLQAWLHSQGLFIAHAAAVGQPHGGVLLAGKTGSGKSTTSLLCLNSDLRYAGDDYALLSANESPWVYSLYNSAKINAGTLPWLPELHSQVTNANALQHEKALVFLEPDYASKLISGFPLRAILLPRVTERTETRVQPVAAEVAFRSLAPDSIFTLLGDAQLTMRGLAELTHQIPCYSLELGSDLEQIPQVISQVLAS
jgi:hypothetical protein